MRCCRGCEAGGGRRAKGRNRGQRPRRTAQGSPTSEPAGWGGRGRGGGGGRGGGCFFGLLSGGGWVGGGGGGGGGGGEFAHRASEGERFASAPSAKKPINAARDGHGEGARRWSIWQSRQFRVASPRVARKGQPCGSRPARVNRRSAGAREPDPKSVQCAPSPRPGCRPRCQTGSSRLPIAMPILRRPLPLPAMKAGCAPAFRRRGRGARQCGARRAA